MPLIPEFELKQQCLTFTSVLFETSTPYPGNFGITAGNFDGAYLSWGAIQYNIGSQTLQPIWKYLIQNHPDVITASFTNAADRAFWSNLFNGGSLTAQQQFGINITDPTNAHRVVEPWRTYFYNLGITQASQDRQTVASEHYQSLAKTWFYEYNLWTRRGYALLWDIAVQSGGISNTVKNLILADFAAMDTRGMTREAVETWKMQIIANRRADAVNPDFQLSYRERKLSIANGTGYVYGGTTYVDTALYNLILEPAFHEEIGGSMTLNAQSSVMAAAIVEGGENDDLIPETDLQNNSWLFTSANFEAKVPVPQNFGISYGNHDGKFLSWGSLRFNIADQTLQPIFVDLITNHPAVINVSIPDEQHRLAFTQIFTNSTQEVQEVFGETITNPDNPVEIIEPWRTYFTTLGGFQEAIDAQRNAILQHFASAKTWLSELGLWTRRGYALLFDIAAQGYNIPQFTKDAILFEMGQRNLSGMSRENVEQWGLQIVVFNTSANVPVGPQRDLYRERGLAIANGSGIVEGVPVDTVPSNLILAPAFNAEIKGQCVMNSEATLVMEPINNVTFGIAELFSAATLISLSEVIPLNPSDRPTPPIPTPSPDDIAIGWTLKTTWRELEDSTSTSTKGET